MVIKKELTGLTVTFPVVSSSPLAFLKWHLYEPMSLISQLQDNIYVFILRLSIELSKKSPPKNYPKYRLKIAPNHRRNCPKDFQKIALKVHEIFMISLELSIKTLFSDTKSSTCSTRGQWGKKSTNQLPGSLYIFVTFYVLPCSVKKVNKL